MFLRILDGALGILFGAFWVAAAAGKVAEMQEFSIAVLAYGIVPPAWVDPFAWAVVAAEFAAGLLLLVRRARSAGAGLALVLLGLFTAAAVVALLQGKFHECGCKLPLLQATTVGPHLLFRNCILVAWGLLLLYRHTGVRAGRDLACALEGLWADRWRIALTGAVVMLVVSNIHQRGLLEKIRNEGGGSRSDFLDEGMKLPAFDGIEVSPGRGKRRIAFGANGPRRVLILFSPTCNECVRSLPSWKAAYAARPPGVEFVGISAADSESTRRFAGLHEIPFPVLSVFPETWKQFKTAAPPRIFQVSPEGMILKISRWFERPKPG